MSSPEPNNGSAASAAAVAVAKASAAAGTTSAQLGYELTTQALKESEAATVFPLLLLEISAIAEGLAAYTATDAAILAATAEAKANTARGTAYWDSP